MTHDQPKWRASRDAPLSPAHLFTALCGLFLPQDIAVNLNTDCSVPGDKIGTVVATTLREGGPACSGTAPRKTAASRATGAHHEDYSVLLEIHWSAWSEGVHRITLNPDCSTPTSPAPGVRVADA
jgi:hypothetical protein